MSEYITSLNYPKQFAKIYVKLRELIYNRLISDNTFLDYHWNGEEFNVFDAAVYNICQLATSDDLHIAYHYFDSDELANVLYYTQSEVASSNKVMSSLYEMLRFLAKLNGSIPSDYERIYMITEMSPEKDRRIAAILADILLIAVINKGSDKLTRSIAISIDNICYDAVFHWASEKNLLGGLIGILRQSKANIRLPVGLSNNQGQISVIDRAIKNLYKENERDLAIAIYSRVLKNPSNLDAILDSLDNLFKLSKLLYKRSETYKKEIDIMVNIDEVDKCLYSLHDIVGKRYIKNYVMILYFISNHYGENMVLQDVAYFITVLHLGLNDKATWANHTNKDIVRLMNTELSNLRIHDARFYRMLSSSIHKGQSNIHKKNELLARQNKALEEKCRDIIVRLKEADKKIKADNAQIADLTRRCKSNNTGVKQEDLLAIREEVTRLKTKLANAEKDIGDSERMRTKSEKEIENLRKSLSVALAESDKLKEKYESLQNANNELATSATHSTIEISHYVNAVKDKKILLIGGDVIFKYINELGLNIDFISKDKKLSNTASFKNVDLIVIYAGYVSHAAINGALNYARTHNVPYTYFNGQNAEQFAIEMFKYFYK